MRYTIAIQSIQVLYAKVPSIKFPLVMSGANNLLYHVVENRIDDYDMCAHNMTQIDLTLKFNTSVTNLTDFG